MTSRKNFNMISNSKPGYEPLDDDTIIKSTSDNSTESRTVDKEEMTVIMHDVKVYKRRWYIVGLFSMFSMMQCAIWNTWGPVSHSAMAVLGWHVNDIAMMANHGFMMTVLGMGFFMWLLVEKGLRWAMILSTGLCAAGTLVRCFTLEEPYVTPLMHIGAALNGLAGPLAQGACTMLSVTWFPPHERITATSITIASNFFGAGLSFLIGPLIVADKTNASRRDSSLLANTTVSPEDLAAMKSQIGHMLVTYAVFAGSIFVASVVYFPAKPALPPSAAVAEPNRSNDFLKEVLLLFKKPVYWLLALVYAIAVGIYCAWTMVIDVNLQPIGVTQADAAWLGFYSILNGTVFAFLAARLNDMFSRHVKACLVILFILSAVFFGWYSFIAQGLIPLSLVDLFIAGIIGSGLICGTIPLLFEVCCELAYPVSEAVASGVQTFLFNFVTVFFLFLFFIPNIGVSWVNWFLFAALVLVIPVVALYKEQHVRSELGDVQKGNARIDGRDDLAR